MSFRKNTFASAGCFSASRHSPQVRALIVSGLAGSQPHTTAADAPTAQSKTAKSANLFIGLIILETLPTPARLRSLALPAASLFALSIVSFAGLTRVGLLSADEPRYAAIGRAMAATGDWITPRLWGTPWFEKPPLIYWTTAIGFRLGLGDELAPRLPIALLSAGFLVFLFLTVRRDFGARAAWFACTMLATSAGWLAFSHIAVTDLPVTIFFSAALLMALHPGRGRAIAAGVFLGLAVLSKALVPLALLLPALWFLRRRLAELALLCLAAAAVALPWFLLCYSRNGAPFLDDLIWKQHFARFLTASLQHVQPFWYYAPVLIAGLFPWSPALWLVFQRRFYDDDRLRLLMATAVFGFVFFSASRNKLPGYLLPLVPALAILMGVALDRAKTRAAGVVLGACGLLLGCLPAIREIVPQALLSGISHVSFPFDLSAVVLALIAIPCWYLERRGYRTGAFALTAIVIFGALLVFVAEELPGLDIAASARPIWRNRLSKVSNPCVSKLNRAIHFGINYYADREIPDCPASKP